MKKDNLTLLDVDRFAKIKRKLKKKPRK